MSPPQRQKECEEADQDQEPSCKTHKLAFANWDEWR